MSYKKESQKSKQRVIEFNLSKSVVILVALTTAKVVKTFVQAEDNKKLADTEQQNNERVVYVNSTTNSEGTTLTYQLVGSNSTTWGSYNNATFKYIASNAETPELTENKEISKSTRMPTGSTEYTKVNNIYDMAGNVREFTIEVNYSDMVSHDGNRSNSGDRTPAEHRSISYADNSDFDRRLSCNALDKINYNINQFTVKL
mgnify:CR=1 FL=1